MLLYIKKYSSIASFLPGDLLIIRCTPVEIANRANPYEFDYRFYMENQGIRYYSLTGSTDIIIILPFLLHRKLVYRALIIREKSLKCIKRKALQVKDWHW